jgi:hypothetical protein
MMVHYPRSMKAKIAGSMLSRFDIILGNLVFIVRMFSMISRDLSWLNLAVRRTCNRKSVSTRIRPEDKKIKMSFLIVHRYTIILRCANDWVTVHDCVHAERRAPWAGMKIISTLGLKISTNVGPLSIETAWRNFLTLFFSHRVCCRDMDNVTIGSF